MESRTLWGSKGNVPAEDQVLVCMKGKNVSVRHHHTYTGTNLSSCLYPILASSTSSAATTTPFSSSLAGPEDMAVVTKRVVQREEERGTAGSQ